MNAMNKVGVFKIKDSFQITGRGLVALGHLIEGTVKVGQRISLQVDGQIFLLKISGVEFGKPKENQEPFLGLRISNDNPSLNINLKNVKLQEQEAELFD